MSAKAPCTRVGPECSWCGNLVCCGCIDIKQCCGPCQYRRLIAQAVAAMKRKAKE